MDGGQGWKSLSVLSGATHFVLIPSKPRMLLRLAGCEKPKRKLVTLNKGPDWENVEDASKA